MCLFHQTKGKKYGNTAPYGPAARGKTNIGGMFHQTKGKKHGNTAPYGPAARGKTYWWQLPGYLYPRDYKSTGHWLMVTGHRASDDPPTIIHVIFSGTQSGRSAVFRR